MKEILVSKKFIAFIDDEDFDKISKIKWSKHNLGYALSSKGYMHRIILNAPKDKKVDHIDGNPLNNQKLNLRFCEQFENTRNRLKSKNTSSQYKGVSFNKKRKKWHAYIMTDYKRTHLGFFDSEINAAREYNRAAIIHHGQFAKLNITEVI